MEYLFFLMCVFFLFWKLPQVAFLKKSGLSPVQLRWLLFCKMALSLAIGFYFFEIVVYTDYLSNHEEAKLEFDLLMENPALFFTDFKKDIEQYGLGGIFNSSSSFWGYLNYHLLAKLTALLNLATKGNFYINTAIFSSFTFFGHIAFFRIFSSIYKGKNDLLMWVCFLVPSLLLYTSCIHKDGVIFVCVALASFYFYQLLERNTKPGFKLILLLFFALGGILLFRNYILVAMLPAMAVAVLVKKVKFHGPVVAAVSYIFFIAAFFATVFLNNSFNLPEAVVKRKADFALLDKGKTNLELKELQPNFVSFARNVPRALNHSLLRPYPFEFKGIAVQLAALELYLYLALCIFVVFTFKRHPQSSSAIHPFNIYGIAFFFTIAIIIGLIIPNAGAITRYRSIFWLFLLCPVICHLDSYIRSIRQH